jgi:hypothetical protein
MRKFILITAMVLVSATAQAAGTRSLTLASNDEPGAAGADAPKYVERPAAVDTTSRPVADQATPKTAKPKRRHQSTEARVIYELHRHGIYW